VGSTPDKIISIDLSFLSFYVPGFDSASNRNEYHEFSWRVKGTDCLGNVGVSMSHDPMGLHGMLQR
jgi:hypothetical protein